MSNSDLLPFFAGVAGDVMSAFNLIGGNTLSSAAQSYLSKRRRENAEILIRELKNGFHGEIQFDQYDIDPLLDIGLRLAKSINEGLARENLRLLAQVIAGMKKNKALDGDKFKKWAAILEHMTRDELMYVGKVYCHYKKSLGNKSEDRRVASEVHQDMLQSGYDSETCRAIEASVSRTGLVVLEVLMNGMSYEPSPWLIELGTLADLENSAIVNR